VVDVTGEPGDPNIVLSRDSGDGPSGSASEAIQKRNELDGWN